VNISGQTLLADYRRAKETWPFIEDAEQAHDLPALLLYAVGSRETNLKNIKGDFSRRPHESSKRFHGFGVWQRDSDAFGVDESYLRDVRKQAEDAPALAAGLSVDQHTTGRDYSADVLARHAFLVAHVEEDISIVDKKTEEFLEKQFDSIRGRIDRAVQRVGGRSNAVYNNDNENFRDLVMAEEALAKAEEARRLAKTAVDQLTQIKQHLNIP
jgi:hypothetical protein